MAQPTEKESSNASVYGARIGSDTNENEVTGFWMFLAGIILGAAGIVVYSTTDAATMGRAGGYVLVASGPTLIMAGAVLQFPLQKMATQLTLIGMLITVVAGVWFLVIFPEGWSTTTGNVGIVVTYIVGLAVIGIAGVVVPQETSEQPEKELAAIRGEKRQAEAELADVRRENEQLAADLHDLEETQGNNGYLAAQLTSLRSTQSQFELYEDYGGQWRWRLRHETGDVLAASNKGYDHQHSAQSEVREVRRDALGATTLLIESEDELPEEGTSDGLVLPDQTDSQATFELYVGKGDDHRWRLVHDNGHIIANAAQGYASKSGAEHSIEAIREYVGPAEYLQPEPTAIEIYRDEEDKHRWRLLHKNGNNLGGSGEGYPSGAAARQAIDELRAGIDEAEIEVYEDDSGEFRWRLRGDEDNVKFDSTAYESRSGAEDAVERVRTFLPEADLIDVGEAAFDVYEGEGGDQRWRLRHRNGQILANGTQGYASHTGVWDGIESVKRNAPNAPLEETDH